MRLIVTRPRAQAEPWVQALRVQGVDAVALPLIEIRPLPDTRPLVDAWHGLAQQREVMFVSANAVDAFFAARPPLPAPGWPPAVRAAATGPGTVAALRARGVPAAAIDAPADDAARLDSEALWERLAGRDWRGTRVLVVRGEDGRDWLAAQWQQAGAQVRFLEAYTRGVPSLDEAAQALVDGALAEPRRHGWHFSSAQAAGHLGRMAPGRDWSVARAAASHPRIAQAVAGLGFGQVDVIGAALSDVVHWVQAQA